MFAVTVYWSGDHKEATSFFEYIRIRLADYTVLNKDDEVFVSVNAESNLEECKNKVKGFLYSYLSVNKDKLANYLITEVGRTLAVGVSQTDALTEREGMYFERSLSRIVS